MGPVTPNTGSQAEGQTDLPQHLFWVRLGFPVFVYRKQEKILKICPKITSLKTKYKCMHVHICIYI